MHLGKPSTRIGAMRYVHLRVWVPSLGAEYLARVVPQNLPESLLDRPRIYHLTSVVHSGFAQSWKHVKTLGIRGLAQFHRPAVGMSFLTRFVEKVSLILPGLARFALDFRAHIW